MDSHADPMEVYDPEPVGLLQPAVEPQLSGRNKVTRGYPATIHRKDRRNERVKLQGETEGTPSVLARKTQRKICDYTHLEGL